MSKKKSTKKAKVVEYLIEEFWDGEFVDECGASSKREVKRLLSEFKAIDVEDSEFGCEEKRTYEIYRMTTTFKKIKL